MYTTAMNVTDRPVIIDSAGRILGGGEFGPVDSSCEEVRLAEQAGTLRIMPEGFDRGNAIDPQVEEAKRQADSFNARSERLENLPADQFEKLIEENSQKPDGWSDLVRNEAVEIPAVEKAVKSAKAKDDE